ncbi:MAG: phosphatidate cytidylyltransferase [Planctomycetia bacterium]|nr:MAG: phosphatidate cytidylyltransferase [Planctomycetia bacterium]
MAVPVVLRQRLVSGTLLATGLVGVVILDGWLSSLVKKMPFGGLEYWLLNGALTTAVLLGVTTLAARELLRFARHAGLTPHAPLVYFFSAGLIIGPYISSNHQLLFGWRDESWAMVWMALALGCAFYLQAARRSAEHAMNNLAITIFIIFYTGGLASFLTRLRMDVGGWQGATIALYSLAAVKCTDIGAYFIGSAVGRTKLIEWLSPKKTWEGLAGGLAVAVGVSIALGLILTGSGAIRPSFHGLPLVVGFSLLGLSMGVMSVAGDLCASLLKRGAAVKDSGHSIPGMGGILDVIDSPLLAAPVAWFFWTRAFPIGAG